MDNNKPNKKYAVIIIILSAILICGVSLLYFNFFYERGDITAVATPSPEPPAVTAAPTPSPSPSPTPTPTPTPPPTPTPTPEPTPTPAPTIRPLFAELIERHENEDIVGYINIDGTSVDYVVVQSGDNEFYLGHDIDKNESHAGWIFLDYENDVSIEDYHTIIYGHNMKADTMFHSIRYYRDYEYFNKHRTITFNTLYDDHEWEVFSFYKTDISFAYTQVIFRDRESYFTLAQKFKAKSIYETGVEITEDDRILTLSTCTNESENTRFVLHARLTQ